MSTTIAQAEPKPKSSRQPRRISKEQFLRDYSNREDGYKYEWNDGIIEKTSAMNQQQAIMQAVFLRYFIQTSVFKEGGLFTAETDMDTSPVQTRRPDLAIYTAGQIRHIKQGENQVAIWVAEVISPNDKAEDVNRKLEEYFRAGVQVVWHIFPHSQKVDVYTSPDDVTICRGKTICSGAPAVPDLQIAAETLFA